MHGKGFLPSAPSVRVMLYKQQSSGTNVLQSVYTCLRYLIVAFIAPVIKVCFVWSNVNDQHHSISWTTNNFQKFIIKKINCFRSNIQTSKNGMNRGKNPTHCVKFVGKSSRIYFCNLLLFLLSFNISTV